MTCCSIIWDGELKLVWSVSWPEAEIYDTIMRYGEQRQWKSKQKAVWVCIIKKKSEWFKEGVIQAVVWNSCCSGCTIGAFLQQGWKHYVLWRTKAPAPQTKFRRTLRTLQFCAPRHFTRYTCSPHLVPRRAPNKIGYEKIDYGQMKQYNILQFPHVRAGRLSDKSKP